MKHKYIFLLAPVPASRPRVTRWGTYYGKKYTNFRKAMAKMVEKIEAKMMDGNVRADVTFLVEIPKSYSTKKKQELCGKFSTARMDLDNLEKAVYDSLSGYVYKDDSQIVEHTTRKIWVINQPRIEVVIEPT